MKLWFKGLLTSVVVLVLVGAMGYDRVGASDAGWVIEVPGVSKGFDKPLALTLDFQVSVSDAFKVQKENVEVNGVRQPTVNFVRVNGVLMAEAVSFMGVLGYQAAPAKEGKAIHLFNSDLDNPSQVNIFIYEGNSKALVATPYVTSTGYTHTLGGITFKRGGKFYIPVKGVAQAMGMEVAWDDTLRITSVTDNLPILFVHGFNGNENSFSKSVENLSSLTDTIITLTVKKNGQVDSSVALTRNYMARYKNPMFVVVFEDNKATLSTTTRYLSKAVDYVRNNVGVTKINIVAHSFGGLVSANYIMQSSNSDSKVNKLVTLSSPINGALEPKYWLAGAFLYPEVAQGVSLIGTVRDLNPVFKSVDFKEFQNKLKGGKFNQRIQVMSLGGLDDKVVPDKTLSAFGLLRGTSNIVVGRVSATHTSIHDKKEISSLVAYFLRHDRVNPGLFAKLQAVK